MKDLVSIKVKNKLTVFSGYVSFISVLITISIIIYSAIEKFNSKYREDEVLLIFAGIMVILTLLSQYLLATKFWKNKISEYESIILDNRLLEEKIKNHNLKTKLDETKN